MNVIKLNLVSQKTTQLEAGSEGRESETQMQTDFTPPGWHLLCVRSLCNTPAQTRAEEPFEAELPGESELLVAVLKMFGNSNYITGAILKKERKICLKPWSPAAHIFTPKCHMVWGMSWRCALLRMRMGVHVSYSALHMSAAFRKWQERPCMRSCVIAM